MSNDYAQQLWSTLDREAIRLGVAHRKEHLFVKVSDALSSAIGSMSVNDSLSFRLSRNGNLEDYVEPNPSRPLRYPAVLLTFICGARTYTAQFPRIKTYDLESAVTPVAEKAAEEAVADFYSETATTEAVVDEILSQIVASAAVQSVVSKFVVENARFLKQEVKDAISEDVGGSVALEAIDAIGEILSTAAGQKVLLGVSTVMGTVLSTAVGKKMLLIAAHHAAGATAFKVAIIGAIKKIGLMALMKTAVGKGIIALLAGAGIAVSSPLVIVMPIVLSIIAWEVSTFPEKLSKKVPPNVVNELKREFGELNRDVLDKIGPRVCQALLEALTDRH